MYDVPPPRMPPAAERLGGFVYPVGVPTELAAELCALEQPVPTFESDAPPPLRVSPAVRAAWSEALAELEARNEQRAVGQGIAAGVGGGLVLGVAATALACTVQ